MYNTEMSVLGLQFVFLKVNCQPKSLVLPFAAPMWMYKRQHLKFSFHLKYQSLTSLSLLEESAFHALATL